MGTVVVPAIVREGYSVQVDHPQEVRLKISGNADMELLPRLSPLLLQLHEQVVDAKQRLVVVDFRDLYFMNSSCFKTIITWISWVQKLDGAAIYTVQFISNPNLHWQRRNLEAIKQFAPEIVEIVRLAPRP